MRFFPPPLIKVVKQVPLTDDEISDSLALEEENVVWRSIHQLIDFYKEDSLEAAKAEAGQEKQMASTLALGGYDWLDTLQQELYRRRLEGLQKQK